MDQVMAIEDDVQLEEAGKSTLYYPSPFGFGYKRREVRAIRWGEGKCAQYTNAAQVAFVEPRCRNWNSFVDCSRRILILKGWHHPSPEPAQVQVGSTVDGNCKVITYRSRHLSCAPQWGHEFESLMGPYLAAQPSIVRVDFRKAPVLTS